jgi:hypothetical protein
LVARQEIGERQAIHATPECSAAKLPISAEGWAAGLTSLWYYLCLGPRVILYLSILICAMMAQTSVVFMRLSHGLYLLLRVVLRDMEEDRGYCELVRCAYQEKEEGEEVQGKKKFHSYELNSYGFVGGSVKLRADELPLLIA